MEIFQNIWHNQKKNQGDHSEEILPKYKENGLTKTEIVEGNGIRIGNNSAGR